MPEGTSPSISSSVFPPRTRQPTLPLSHKNKLALLYKLKAKLERLLKDGRGHDARELLKQINNLEYRWRKLGIKLPAPPRPPPLPLGPPPGLRRRPLLRQAKKKDLLPQRSKSGLL